MRTNLLTLAAMLCMVCVPLHAQSLFELGVKAGVNHSFPNSLSSGLSSESGIGFQVGGFVQLGLFDLVALAGELTVDRRSFSIIDGPTKLDASMTTLNIPVLLRIGLPLKMMLELGPQYSHILSSDGATTTDGIGYSVFGVIWKPAFSLQFGLRYMRALTSISTAMDSDVSTNVTQFSVGYAF
ncbi:MAG: outer membrane beta-barrel protein [Bacteroidetes bacterium]|nr:outer membrane beta-barrel protein [Bacteroidota bacterium]